MREFSRDVKNFVIRKTASDQLHIVASAALIVAIVTIVVLKRTFWTPDVLLILVLLIGLALGKTRELALRFIPFFGLLLVYESMRSVADDINTYVNYMPMIQFDLAVFGELPTITLQRLLWHGSVQWYDFYLYGLYIVHFLVPAALALVFWKWRPRLYWPFVGSIVGISFAAFVVYMLFPAAPPWLAAQKGLISGQFEHVTPHIWAAMNVTNYSEVYGKLSPNLVAAVPSLHATYPSIVVIFCVLAFGIKRTWWLFLYPISMWIGIVYLGEHYMFDIVASFALMVTFFGVYITALLVRQRRAQSVKAELPATAAA